jgi:hypothetical protein
MSDLTPKFIEIARLRLFLLSLLWRAAATSRPEFRDVVLPPDDLIEIARMLIENDSGLVTFYPVQLFQLSTKGVPHSMAPFVRTAVLPASEGHPEYKIPHFRFYLDGLIVHIHVPPFNDRATASLGGLILGAREELGVITVTSERSFQHETLQRAAIEAERNWPDVMRKLR